MGDFLGLWSGATEETLRVEAPAYSSSLIWARSKGSSLRSSISRSASQSSWLARTRLRRMPLVSISPPDDALIKALFVKLFVDRQLVVDTTLVEYLCLRTERSFSAVRAIVERLDREALAQGRRLSRPMAAKILGWASEA